jgi:hypothetical protein
MPPSEHIFDWGAAFYCSLSVNCSTSPTAASTLSVHRAVKHAPQALAELDAATGLKLC